MPNNGYLDALSTPDPRLLSSVRQRSSLNHANQYGFPLPNEQFPSPAAATTKYYFADETKWRAIQEYGDFDDIVIGTGFCALAYIDKALELDPKRRILVLERGGVWLTTHFQNLPLPFNLLLNSASEIYPWALSSAAFHSDIKYVRGCVPFFGGRSTFSSAWSPRPPLGLMRDFPKSLLSTAAEERFWRDSKDLLNVVEPDQLFGGEYQALQIYTGERLSEAVSSNLAIRRIDSSSYVEPANLAVGKTTTVSKLAFEKFSTPGPLLKLYERQCKLAKKGEGSPLTIATDVVVERFEIDPLDKGQRVHLLHTSRGALSFSLPKKPNIILATGAIPACTLVLNSVAKQHGRAGSRLSGHFLGRVGARFPLPERFRSLRSREWEERKTRGKGVQQKVDDTFQIAAYYLAGREPSTGLQYHGEITVTHAPLAEEQQDDAARLCPDFFSAPTDAQLTGSHNHVIVACVMVGEIDESNSECRVQFNRERSNKTTNVDLQLALTESNKKLREVMYRAAFQAIFAIAGDKTSDIEFWHEDGRDTGKWDRSEPDRTQFQIHGLVDESSTLYMDDALPLHPNLEQEAESRGSSQPSVDRNYRVYGTGNVYATGSAIFPTSGSWNPTLTMCGFSQDLAIKLHKSTVFRQVFSLSVTALRIHHLAGTTENLLNALRRKVSDTLLSLSPKGPLNQRGVWQLGWGPVVWQSEADASTVGPDLSWYVAYHDSLEFEDGSLHPTYVIAVAGTSGTYSNKVVDFEAYVSDGQFRTRLAEVYTDALYANKPYITLSTASAVHTLLTNPAPSVTGVKSLLGFIHGVKTAGDPSTRTLPRFVFAGHSTGGSIASTVALALVSGGVIPADRTLTYSTAAPTPGNATFADLFERTFRASIVGGEEGYKSWNVNVVNTLDVVPLAWCHQRTISPIQNLNNIPTLYGTPIIPETIGITDALISSANESGVVLKPLPSRYFTGALPSAPPASLDAFLQIAVQQHVQAYLREVGGTVPESDSLQDGLYAKTEAELRLDYPIIRDFERSRDRVRISVGPSPGAGPGIGGWIWVGPGSPGTSTETWATGRVNAGTGTGIVTSVETRSDSKTLTVAEPTIGAGSRAGSRVGSRAGSTTNSPTGTKFGTATAAVFGTEPIRSGPETGTGLVTVTPLSLLTVLKFGSPEYNLVPLSTQNRPLLVYRDCFPDWVSSSDVKSHLSAVGVVEPHRTGTLLIKDHFYTMHKVLCVTNGQAQLRFGGEGNQSRLDVEVNKGDVVIIPAGVPQRLLRDVGRNLEVVESYPTGAKVEAESRRLGSRPQQSHLYSIASLGWFTRDPIYGDQGPVLGC